MHCLLCKVSGLFILEIAESDQGPDVAPSGHLFLNVPCFGRPILIMLDGCRLAIVQQKNNLNIANT